MLNKDDLYMRIVDAVAQQSHAKKRKVGALIVKDGCIISEGYNGTPPGLSNVCEEPVYSKALGYPMDWVEQDFDEVIEHEPIGWYTLATVMHAETNAIGKVAKSNSSSLGATMYCSLAPCLNCAKLIVQAGIEKVIYAEVYKRLEGVLLLEECGVKHELYKVNRHPDYLPRKKS